MATIEGTIQASDGTAIETRITFISISQPTVSGTVAGRVVSNRIRNHLYDRTRARPNKLGGKRTNIGSPALGLMIYNLDTNALNFYNGSGWIAL